MSTGFIVYITIQFIASVALVYGYLHEKKVIAFEDRLWAKIKAPFQAKKQAARVPEPREENDFTLIGQKDYFGLSSFEHVA